MYLLGILFVEFSTIISILKILNSTKNSSVKVSPDVSIG